MAINVTKRVTKMHWVLEHGPMIICCGFGKHTLKTKGLRAYTRKMNLTPWWPQMSLQVDENVLESGAWSNEYLLQI